jgi:nucleotide-binding universal stress UspA family protein
MERIVVGFDGSEHAHKALERAADIAHGAIVAVVGSVHVEGWLGGAVSPIDPAEAEARDRALSEARKYLEDRGVNGVYIEGSGNPADVIIEEARESGADLIVVGTRGRNAARRLALGSVSTNIIAHAPCDVLVVR